MKCLNPFTSGKAAFGCGQCMPCRFNRRRTWTHRIMLEGMCHEERCFVTLTYADGNSDGELHPEHFSLWLKRLRKRAGERRIRFFGVGEYGDKSGRPHYHAALFGWPHCLGGMVKGGTCQCTSCCAVRETWGFGHILVGTLEPNSAQYLCGYVTKKMTHSSDVRLRGRAPEFARMSLRPGIGAHAMANLVAALRRYGKEETLPSRLRHNKSLMPLGRYLRSKVSEGLGQSELVKERLTDEALSAAYEELQGVREVAFATERSVREVFAEVNEPYARSLQARFNRKERTL